MAAAFSIISLVIFFGAWACACAHSTPGNSVPARPIPEQVFMKLRRSSIFILLIGQSPGARVRYHSTPSAGSQLFCCQNSGGHTPAMAPISFSRAKLNVVRFVHLERSFHDPSQKVFDFPATRACDFLAPASANDNGRESSRRRERSCPQGSGDYSENFPGTCFFSWSECPGAIPQQRRGPLRRRSLRSRGNGGQLRLLDGNQGEIPSLSAERSYA